MILASLAAAGLAVAAHGAQDAGLPGAYLRSVGSPRVAAMARAVTAAAEGVDAAPWNPAALGLLRQRALSLSHTQTQEGAYLENVGYAQQLYRFGGVGLNYFRLDSGGLPQTDDFNRSVGTFHDVEQTVMAGYGVTGPGALSLGATLKYSRQSLAEVSAGGWGLDLGLRQDWRWGLSWGLRLQNALAPSLRYATGSDEFPRVWSGGLALRLWRDRLLVAADARKMLGANEPLQAALGVEASLLSCARLRAGFDFFHSEYDLGLGWQFGRHGLDYAASSPTEGDYAQNIGYSYSWGGYSVAIHARPEVFSPAAVSKTTTFFIELRHARPIYSWELWLRDQTGNVVRAFRGSGNPPDRIEWNGTNDLGANVAAGSYRYCLTLRDIDARQETTPEQIVTVKYATLLDAIEIKPF